MTVSFLPAVNNFLVILAHRVREGPLPLPSCPRETSEDSHASLRASVNGGEQEFTAARRLWSGAGKCWQNHGSGSRLQEVGAVVWDRVLTPNPILAQAAPLRYGT